MGANAKSHCSFSAVASSSSLSSIPDRRVTNSEADSSSSAMNMDDEEETTVDDEETQNCHSAVQILACRAGDDDVATATRRRS